MSTRRTADLATDIGQLGVRVIIAVSFLLAVADRLGMLGSPGDPGVSWGSWGAFREYTARLVPVPVDLLVDAAAVGATILETLLAVLLIAGFVTRMAATGAAALTLVFGLSMFVFLGPLAPFRYPVFLFTAAAVLLAGLPRHRWSLDAALRAPV